MNKKVLAKELEFEIELRGKLLTMSCDIEWAMLNIMIHCADNPYEQVRRYHKMMMHEKIQNLIADLKRYNKRWYNEYEDTLNELWEFKEIRNDFCHHTIEWDGNSQQSFKILFIDDKESMTKKPYTMAVIRDSMEKFRKLVLEMALLWDKVRLGLEE
jgi:hypothetical protein